MQGDNAMNDICRILVVEDEAIEAMALQGRLENLGYAVSAVVDSGEEAIERAAELSPDLVLMDIRLRGAMDGIEAAGQIRVRFDIPVVYLTAYADRATLDRAKLTGPYSYLLKPVEERALHSAVEIALYKHGIESALRQSNRLAAVGELAAGVAHEVNNPLAIMQSFAELLMDKLEGSLRDDALKIFEEAQRATKIILDLLTFARQQEPSKSEVIATDVLNKALGLKVFDFRVNHIQVQLDLAADVPRVMADENQLLQVFLNILTNAQQAMAEAHSGGNLRIQGRRVDRNLSLSFEDDGPGISKDNLNKIFDPFFSTKGVGKGTGLGLSVSYGIVLKHDGRLWAESEPVSGATFHLELPGLPLPLNPEVASIERLR